MKKINLFSVLMLFAGGVLAFGATTKGDCDCEAGSNSSSDGKLVNAQEIIKGFEQGKGKVKVIVNLNEPPKIRAKVRWKSKTSLQELHDRIKAIQLPILATLTKNEFKLRHRFENQAGFSGEIALEALEKLIDDPRVISIEPVYLLEPHLNQGIPLMDADVYRSTYNGEGIAIAICDTGVDYTHPRLGGGGFPNVKVIGGYDCGDNNSDPMPHSSRAHGTACAGIAAGDLGTIGDYVGGVAYNARLYALKITAGSASSASSDAMVAAWDWCVSHQNDDPAHPIMVISTSFGGNRHFSSCDSTNTSMTNAANNAVAAGITVLASSGNDGYCNSMCWPACVSNVISVGAVYDEGFGTFDWCVDDGSCATPGGNRTCDSGEFSTRQTSGADIVTAYSNTAAFLDILAPAHNAYTTDIVGTGGYSTGDYYTSFGGTSAACPYAAGAVACLQEAAMDLAGRYLTPSQVRYKFVTTGDLVTDSKVPITVPRVNLAAAIDSFGDGDRWEPDDTELLANWIYDGSMQNHSIRPIGDVDWVKFSVGTESEVIIETSGASGDTRMWLYDGSTNLLEYNDDGGTGHFSRIDRLCGSDALGAGTYYVRIEEYGNDSYIPSYNINLTVTSCSGGNHDPQLSDGLVDPGSGYSSTDFYWYIHYYDEDGDSPSTKQVYIDGTAYTMSLHSGSASNGTYVYGPKNLSVGNHTYYFYFTDGSGGSCRLPGSGTYPGPNVDTGGPVYFPDAALKAAVEKDLDISNPTPADMLDLVRLNNAYNKGIVELTGLEYATNLWYASLGRNDISDISPLSGLTKLAYLGLYRNQISDISAVSGLTNLIGLYLNDNQISDISSLSGLTNLRELHLYDNQISDISSLSGLTNLTELYLDENQINDISALSGLTNLTELHLHGNEISNISSLSGLTNLTELYLDDNQISDISSLSGLTNLRKLNLRDNPLNRAAYCTYLPLILANNPGIDLDYDPNPDPGAECPVSFPDYSLKNTVEEALGISDPMEADMLGLTYLDASSRGIADLTGLEYATNLMQLDLHNNRISDISPISGLANLVELNLHGNQINDIPVISEMVNLMELNLGVNPLSDISGLEGLMSLTDLFLYEGQITDISALSTLASIEHLSLSHNHISDISVLLGLTSLQELDLRENPLNIAAHSTYLPLILANNPGINLFYDPNPFDFHDFATFALHWLKTDCGVCGGVDLDQDNDVDLEDLRTFCTKWLEGAIP